MKTLLLLALSALSLSGCLSIQNRIDQARFGDNPYLEPPFYARYLNTGSEVDRQIQSYLEGLRVDPENPVYHNELGRLLVLKGFPNDAEREFRRALAADPDFYPALYNMALVDASRGDIRSAIRNLDATLDRKPGHAAAMFQKGLLLEKTGRTQQAIAVYARAFEINFDLLRPSVNPQIIESELVDLALLKLYPDEQRRRALRLQPTPPELIPAPEAPSEIESLDEIVAPAAQTPDVSSNTQSSSPPPE